MSDHDREPLRILVFSASLRAGSLNTRFAHLAAEVIERHGERRDASGVFDRAGDFRTRALRPFCDVVSR